MGGKKGERTPSSTPNALQSAHQEQIANKKKRAHYVQAVNRAHGRTEADGFTGQTQFILEESLATLNSDWNSYKKEYAKIFDENLGQIEEDEAEQEFVSTEEAYLATSAKIRERIANLTLTQTTQPLLTVQPSNATDNTQSNAFMNIQNTWGYFNGDYAEWPKFRDRFKADMHDRQDVSVTLKWNHLRMSLSGNALRIVGTLRHTDEDYDHAWQRLCHQYNDHYATIQTLIRRMLNLPKMEHASADNLRNIIDTVRSCLCQLNSYISTQNWDQLVILFVVDKLDNDTSKDWERLRRNLTSFSESNAPDSSLNAENDQINEQEGAVGGQVTLPTWSQMEKFLEEQAKILFNIRTSTLDAEVKPFTSKATRVQGQPKQNSNAKKQTHINPNMPPCLLCQVKHAMFSCPMWLAKGMDDREAFQRTERLCITCVQPHHGNTPCWGKPDYAKPCPACLKANIETIYHNSTLCRRTEAKRMQKMLVMQQKTPPTLKED